MLLTQLTLVFHEFLTSSRHNMFQSSKWQPQPRSGRDQVKELPLSVSSAILVRSSEAEWLKSAGISGRKTRWTVLNSAKTLLNSCVSGCLSAFSRGLSCDQRGKYRKIPKLRMWQVAGSKMVARWCKMSMFSFSLFFPNFGDLHRSC